MTVFGYNTDVRHDGTVYHVQTEAREGEFVLTSSIFVRGQCVGKYSSSYAAHAQSDSQVHDSLTAQHRTVVNSIREGRISSLLRSEEDGAGNANPCSAIGLNGSQQGAESLSLSWVETQPMPEAGGIRVRICLRSGDRTIENAHVVGRVDSSGMSSTYSHAITDGSGETELFFRLDPQREDAAFNIVVQAASNLGSVTRKFALRRG